MPPGSAEEHMHLLQYFGKLCMDLVIPVLCLNHGRRLPQKAGTDFDDQVVLVIPRLDQCLQDPAFISSIQCNNRKDACLSTHLTNFVGKLAEILLYFLGEREQIDRVLEGIRTEVLQTPPDPDPLL